MTWRITRGDQQFIAKDMAELKIWAASGKVQPDDLIQRPGEADWIYAAELAELDGLIRGTSGGGPDEADFQKQKSEKTLRQIVLIVTGIGVVIAFGVMLYVMMNPPNTEDKDIKTGTYALAARDALVTKDCPLRSGPNASASAVTNLEKDERISLVGKHGDYYEVRNKGGQQGFIALDDLLPGYYLDKKEYKKWDPMFNPDRYMDPSISDWQVVMDDFKPQDVEHMTILSFTISNTCQYDMEHIVLLVHFYDSTDAETGREVKVEEVTLEEVVPAHGSLYHELEFEVNIDEIPRATMDVIGARIIDPPVR